MRSFCDGQIAYICLSVATGIIVFWEFFYRRNRGMFEQKDRGEDELLIEKRAAKPIIDRINMGRLYVFNLFASAVMLIITGLLAILKYSVIVQQTKMFLLLTVIMLMSALAVCVTTKTKQRQLFDKVCYAYLGIMSACLYGFAFCSITATSAIMFYFMIMMMVGFLPILDRRSATIVYGAEIIPVIGLVIFKAASSEGYLAVASVTVMSGCVAFNRYNAALKRVSDKLSRDLVVNEAETDPLTKLLNRRGLDRRLETIWPMCIRQSSCAAVLMLDIDNFKKYNDAFGHPAGDECIRQVTEAISRAVKRRTDYAARVGGEEFLVLLTNIDPKSAVKWALDLKKDIDELKIRHAATNFNPYVTVSMGLSCSVVRQNVTFEDMKEEADRSLYDAKNNGRACLYYKHKCFGRNKSLDAAMLSGKPELKVSGENE